MHTTCPPCTDRTTHMAVAGAGAAYRYHRHGVDVCRSMAFPAPRGGGNSSSYPYSSASAAAASLSPAFATAGSGVPQQQQLDVLDYLSDDGGAAPTVPEPFGTPLPPRMPVEAAAAPPVVPDSGYGCARPRSASPTVAPGDKIVFRTRSEEDVLDDGYKWRKYGKKSVKNSPNPRNYFRCSTEGCNVKKRVERDKDDTNYVVTMYEGVHNHASPSTVYYAFQDPTSGRFFVSGMHYTTSRKTTFHSDI